MTLAEDLVTAAKSALALAAVEGRLPNTRESLPFDSIARVAAVAVLRALAAEECAWREEELAGLADEIEIRSALSEDIESERLGVPQAEKPQP